MYMLLGELEYTDPSKLCSTELFIVMKSSFSAESITRVLQIS